MIRQSTEGGRKSGTYATGFSTTLCLQIETADQSFEIGKQVSKLLSPPNVQPRAPRATRGPPNRVMTGRPRVWNDAANTFPMLEETRVP
jgi:hypothetical protein